MHHLYDIALHFYDFVAEFFESMLARATGLGSFWLALLSRSMALMVIVSPAVVIWAAYEFQEYGEVLLGGYFGGILVAIAGLIVFRYVDGQRDSEEMGEVIACRKCGRENSIHTKICPRCNARSSTSRRS